MHLVSYSRRVFLIINAALMGCAMLLCLIPILNILAISFSTGSAADAGLVGLYPIKFTTQAYSDVLKRPQYFRALFVSFQRIILGWSISLVMTVLVAYPMSKERKYFKTRHIYMGFFLFAMLFNGGLIPTYIVVQQLGLINSIWALVLPSAVNIFNCVLMMNFFRGLPHEIEEAALIDGASYFRSLVYIFLPLSLPSLATISLITIVGYWNEWMYGIIYVNNPNGYPLSSYLQTIIKVVNLSKLTAEEMLNLDKVTTRTSKAAQVFIALIPLLAIYPFLQKYFVKGLVLGSVKG